MNGAHIRNDFSRRFQLRFCAAMILGGIATSGILAVLFNQPLGSTYRHSLELLTYFREQVGDALVLTFVLQVILIALVTILINIYFSHKIAGPIFRYETFLEDLIRGELRYDVRTRDKDQLKPLVGSINGVVERQRRQFLEARDLENRLRDYIDEGRTGDSSRLLEDVMSLQTSLEERPLQ